MCADRHDPQVLLAQESQPNGPLAGHGNRNLRGGYVQAAIGPLWGQACIRRDLGCILVHGNDQVPDLLNKGWTRNTR